MKIDEKHYRATVRKGNEEASYLVVAYNLDPAKRRIIGMDFTLHKWEFQRDPKPSLPTDGDALFRTELIQDGRASTCFEGDRAGDRANDKLLIEEKMKGAFGQDAEVVVTPLFDEGTPN